MYFTAGRQDPGVPHYDPGVPHNRYITVALPLHYRYILGEAYEGLLHTMHVPVQAAPELAADRPGRVRLDAHAPTHTPAHGSSSPRPRAPSDVHRPADTGAAMRDGGGDTFLRDCGERSVDYHSSRAPGRPAHPDSALTEGEGGQQRLTRPSGIPT